MKPKQKSEVQTRLASIDIFTESIVASRFAGRGRSIRKLITPAEAIEIFSSGADRKKGDTRWLAFGPPVIRVGLTAGGDVRVLMVRKAQRTQISAEIGGRVKCFTLWMPNLLCQLRQSGGLWADIERVFAFEGRLTNATSLYMPPVPNGHTDGSLCLGSVKLDTVAHATASEAFEAAFIRSTFTDHMGPVKAKSKYRNIWDAIRKTKGRVPFSHLVKIKTFRAFLNEA